jgi:hypothetical protein
MMVMRDCISTMLIKGSSSTAAALACANVSTGWQGWIKSLRQRRVRPTRS